MTDEEIIKQWKAEPASELRRLQKMPYEWKVEHSKDIIREFVEQKVKTTSTFHSYPKMYETIMGKFGLEGGIMKTLVLPLKRKWFDMIKSGEKKEEYREIKPHYIGILFNRREMLDVMGLCSVAAFEEKQLPKPIMFVKHFDRLIFTLGYPKADDTERRLVFKNPKIHIGTGRPEWGAEHGKQYFVITWEDALVTEEQDIEARR